ncbi:MAG TPA: sigma-70 family RNA polymerase sigma factor [Patescibacteria group bacterium]|nr:sigma-70 family RNA polymerase sigma factor [Patescibacteria group bacterium]
MDKEREQELITRCRAGDGESFGLLYDAYIQKIFNFIYYRVGSREIAEDLTSQTFFKALKKIKKFQGEYFSAWLFRIARNTVIDHYRTSRPTDNIDEFFDLRSHKDLEAEVDTKRTLEEVKNFLKTLKKEQEEVVIMRVWEGLSYKEIAEVIGKSEANCKMIFSRALNSLRRELPLGLFLSLLIKDLF